MKRKSAAKEATGRSPSELIDARIEELGGWRGRTLARARRLIRQADPAVVEEWKWGVPVWSHDGLICTGEVYKNAVKMTFARGASLEDPSGLFNSSLEGNVRRAIDVREGDRLDERAFKALVRAAATLNTSRAVEGVPGKAAAARPKGTAGRGKRSAATRIKASRTPAKKPTLLAGGNPQIAKAEGDAPVQAYIAAMPDWKRDLGRRLDEIVVRNVPNVRKAVKWNSPFYGVEGRGWFMTFHVFTRYVKVTFFPGTSLRPVPPGGTSQEARWIDVHEDELDEAQVAAWVKQAAALPGWMS
jgi:hypothetical protein